MDSRAAGQRAFRERVEADPGAIVHYFRDPTDLSGLVGRALENVRRRRERPDRVEVLGSASRRFDVPPMHRTVVPRPAKRDEIVDALLNASATTAVSVALVGAGGIGKSVLAQQVAHDPRVIEAHPGGVWWLDVGQSPVVEQLAERLYRTLSGGRQPAAGISVTSQLGDAASKEPTLVVLDDVWAPADAVEALMAVLPDNVRTLITTRGVHLDGCVTVGVDALSGDEARQVVLGDREPTTSGELLHSVDTLVNLLGRWALLVAMAAKAARPSLDGPDRHAVIALNGIAEDFRADPTVLDDPASRRRSFARLVERSEAALANQEQDGDLQRFWDLGAYPPDAALEVELLADLWACRRTEATNVAQRIAEVGLATLVPPTVDRPVSLVLHDLIVDYLHRSRCRPGQRPDLHLRCAAPSITIAGQPRDVTPARAAWLAHHLIAAREWDLLERIATPLWRRELLAITGSDAALFKTLDSYARSSMFHPDPSIAAYHYLTATIFAAHVREMLGHLPVCVLETAALLGNPVAALAQAAHRPDAAAALPAVLRTALGAHPPGDIAAQAINFAASIPDIESRGQALAGIAQCIAKGEQRADHAAALAAAEAIPDVRLQGQTLANIVDCMIGDDQQLDHLLTVVDSIRDKQTHSETLLSIVRQLDGDDADRADELIDQAVHSAEAIPSGRSGDHPLATIVERLLADHARPASAVKVANRISSPQLRCRALCQVIRHLSSTDLPRARELMDLAVGAASAISEGSSRNLALENMVERLVVDGAFVDRSIEVAYAIPDERSRSHALSHIVKKLAVDVETADRAVAVAETIPDSWSQRRALILIARQLRTVHPERAARLIDRAIDAVDSQTSIWGREWDRASAMIGVARELASDFPERVDDLVNSAVEATRGVSDEWRRQELVNGIAMFAARRGQIDLAFELVGDLLDDRFRGQSLDHIIEYIELGGAHLDRAIEMAKGIADEWQRSRVLTTIAKRLFRDERHLNRGVDLIRAITDEHAQDEALSEAVQVLMRGRDLPERAVEVAQTIPNDHRRSEALAGIVACLAGDVSQRGRAKGVADLIPDHWMRSAAFRCLAEEAVDVDQRTAAEFLEHSIEAANYNSDLGDRRSATLADIVEKVIGRAIQSGGVAETAENERRADPLRIGPPGDLPAAAIGTANLVERLIHLAETIPEARYRSRAFARIARKLVTVSPGIAAELNDRAVQAANTIERPWSWSKTLAEIAQESVGTRALRDNAIRIAGIIGDDHLRSEALAGIAAQLRGAFPDLAGELFGEAIEAAKAIVVERSRSQALANVVARMAEGGADLDQAIELAGTVPETRHRSVALASVAKKMASGAAQRYRAIELAETLPCDELRPEALAAIASQLVEEEPRRGAELVDRAIKLANTIDDEYLRSKTLADVATHMLDMLSCRDHAIELVRAIPDGWTRAHSLVSSARQLAGVDPHTAAQLSRDAIGVAGSLSDDELSSELSQFSVHLASAGFDVDEALDMLRSVPDDFNRDHAYSNIACHLAREGSRLEQALDMISNIGSSNGHLRSRVLLSAVNRLLSDEVSFERAVQIAKTIPTRDDRSRALAGAAGRVGSLPLLWESLTAHSINSGEVLAAVRSFVAAARHDHVALGAGASDAVVRSVTSTAELVREAS